MNGCLLAQEEDDNGDFILIPEINEHSRQATVNGSGSSIARMYKNEESFEEGLYSSPQMLNKCMWFRVVEYVLWGC